MPLSCDGCMAACPEKVVVTATDRQARVCPSLFQPQCTVLLPAVCMPSSCFGQELLQVHRMLGVVWKKGEIHLRLTEQ